MERKINPDVEFFGLGGNVEFWERAVELGLIDEFEINQVAAGSSVFTVRAWLSSTQKAQENSGGHESDPPATHVAEESKMASTGVFSDHAKLDAWLEFQIQHGHAPDGWPVEMTPEYALGRQSAFVSVQAKLRLETARPTAVSSDHPNFRTRLQLAALNALFLQQSSEAPESPILAVNGYLHLERPELIEQGLRAARIETECVIDFPAVIDALLREILEGVADGKYTAHSIVRLALGEELGRPGRFSEMEK